MSAPRSSTLLLHDGATVSGLMRMVLLALLPGLAVKLWFAGVQVLITLLLVAITALMLEAACLRLRGQASRTALKDGSALLTALLLTLALPASTPWALALAGAAFAILIVKQAFGGLGQNVFNPAMGGYAFLLLAFPQSFYNGPMSDSLASPSSLLQSSDDTLFFAATAGQLLALAYLAGGVVLLARGVLDWLIPVAILVTAALVLAALAPDQSVSPLRFMALHLLNPAWVLAAFFLATDPVTAPVSIRARLAYGILIGGLIVLIHRGGQYTDSVAFAILLGNFFAPLLDQTLRPRVLGRRTADDLESW